MRARTGIMLAAGLAVVGVVGFQQLHAGVASHPDHYRLAALDRGDVVSTVRASGTLLPERQLLVSPAAPGSITAVLIMDNEPVHADQPLATLDASQAQSRLDLARTDLEVARRAVDIAAGQRDRAKIMVQNSDATLAAAQADLSHAQEVAADADRDVTRMAALAKTGDAARVETQKARSTHDEALAGVAAAQARVREAEATAAVTRSDVVVAEAQLANTAAAVASHEAAVRDAELQVSGMTIRAPIDGVVLDHTVVVGQNVGIAPLFTVASDLGRLVLHANIDEADIGRIQPGQPASFTVDSYLDQAFPAVVSLVKHAAQIAQNVVTYDVELAVDNRDGRLLPGMTATATIVTGKDQAALRVPTSALRFTPPGEVADGRPTLWTLGKGGEPVRHQVRPSRADEVYTSVASADLSQGDAVIVGVASPTGEQDRHKSVLGF